MASSGRGGTRRHRSPGRHRRGLAIILHDVAGLVLLLALIGLPWYAATTGRRGTGPPAVPAAPSATPAPAARLAASTTVAAPVTSVASASQVGPTATIVQPPLPPSATAEAATTRPEPTSPAARPPTVTSALPPAVPVSTPTTAAPATPRSTTGPALPVATATPGAAAWTDVYVVRSGDTLQRIAARFGVTVEQLASRNDITNPNRLTIGMRLKVPAPGQ